MVIRQVRNPRFQMPAFSTAQISNQELDLIAGYISSLEGREHLHLESSGLSATVEMHHWMALESLKADDALEAAHHVSHIVELLEPGDHQETMRKILKELQQGGETHTQEHDIEEMLAGSGSPDLTLAQLHLRQALISLTAGDIEESKHHVAHAQDQARGEISGSLAEVLRSLESQNLHDAGHELQGLLDQGGGHH